jgi:hypothetical protein
VEDVF